LDVAVEAIEEGDEDAALLAFNNVANSVDN